MHTGRTIACAMVFCLAVAICPASSARAAMKNDRTTKADIKLQTEDLLRSLKSYTVEQRREAVRVTSADLEKLDKRIDNLERRLDENWAKMDKAARKSARANLKELHRQRNLVAEWYGSLKNGSAKAWDQTKRGFAEAYRSLQKAWEKSEQDLSR